MQTRCVVIFVLLGFVSVKRSLWAHYSRRIRFITILTQTILTINHFMENIITYIFCKCNTKFKIYFPDLYRFTIDVLQKKKEYTVTLICVIVTVPLKNIQRSNRICEPLNKLSRYLILSVYFKFSITLSNTAAVCARVVLACGAKVLSSLPSIIPLSKFQITASFA